MKQEQTSVWTGSFMKVLASNFFLFAALFFVIPSLPEWIAMHTPLNGINAHLMLLGIPLGMILIGPFNAFLFQRFRRKHVGMWAIFILALLPIGYYYATEIWQNICLVIIHGMAFSSALNLDITVHIDITCSDHRKTANALLIKTAMIAQAVGFLIGDLAHDMLNEIGSSQTFFNVATVLSIIPLLFILAVKVPFRAPIEMKRCTLDRFWLPSALVLTANLMLFAFSAGLWIVNRHIEKEQVDFILTAKIVTILCIVIAGVPKLIQMYMGLATHCQRCTANSTLFLTWIFGLTAGAITAVYFASIDLIVPVQAIALGCLVASIVLFLTVVKKYYKRHQRKEKKYDI